MSLPNSSFLVNVARLRYIQALYEPAERRNPDTLVGAFLSPGQRLACRVRGALFLGRLRANPFYHYVLARTRYYDELFLDAVRDGVSSIVNIGCGSDTRAYRFARLLEARRITVLECDQPQAIRAKRELAARRFPTAHVRYLPLELNDDFASALDHVPPGRAFVMMEGVSPYVDRPNFEAFLSRLGARLTSRSVLAYDFKLEGVAPDFGRAQAHRLPGERDAVAAFHHALGWRLERLESSASLTRRLLPDAPPPFEEDCLACLTC